MIGRENDQETQERSFSFLFNFKYIYWQRPVIWYDKTIYIWPKVM